MIFTDWPASRYMGQVEAEMSIPNFSANPSPNVPRGLKGLSASTTDSIVNRELLL